LFWDVLQGLWGRISLAISSVFCRALTALRPELVEKENTLAAEKAETATVGVPNLASTQAQEVSKCVEGDFLSLCPLSTRLRDLLCYGKTKLPAERPGLR
jgi:hypothetical protein